jgi:hypothetical protein
MGTRYLAMELGHPIALKWKRKSALSSTEIAHLETNSHEITLLILQ